MVVELQAWAKVAAEEQGDVAYLSDFPGGEGGWMLTQTSVLQASVKQQHGALQIGSCPFRKAPD